MLTLHTGDLAYWLGTDRKPVRCKIVLVTSWRVYLVATATERFPAGRRFWYVPLAEARFKIAPRDAYIHAGRAYHDASAVRFQVDEPGLHP